MNDPDINAAWGRLTAAYSTPLPITEVTELGRDETGTTYQVTPPATSTNSGIASALGGAA